MSFCQEDKYLQVYAHLYRGEMNRMTIYRQRLDMISTWSMTLLATLSVIYINTGLPFQMSLLFIVPIGFFSCMEARRYRYYCISRHRIRIIEKGFFVGDILQHSVHDPVKTTEYRNQLMDSLINPVHVISYYKAWSIRFQRNYIWFLYFLWACMWFDSLPIFIPLIYISCLVIVHVLTMISTIDPEIDF